MYLYHGTPVSFTVPSLSFCKPYRDFGCGFYLTPNYSVLEFAGYSEAWLRFAVASRLGYTSTEYDLVIGNMAGGGANLKSKFSKFRRASMSIAEVMSIMKHDLTSTNLGLQYAFLTEKALSKLTLIDTEMVEREDAV